MNFNRNNRSSLAEKLPIVWHDCTWVPQVIVTQQKTPEGLPTLHTHLSRQSAADHTPGTPLHVSRFTFHARRRITVQKCNHAKMQRCNNGTMQRCNNLTIQRLKLSSPSRCSGFTLIELLVATVITAILDRHLVPALVRGKRAAQI